MVNHDFNKPEIHFETVCRQDHKALRLTLADKDIPRQWRKAHHLQKRYAALEDIRDHMQFDKNGLFEYDPFDDEMSYSDHLNKLEDNLPDYKTKISSAISSLERTAKESIQRGDGRRPFAHASVLMMLLDKRLQLTAQHTSALLRSYQKNIEDAETFDGLRRVVIVLCDKLRRYIDSVSQTEEHIKATLDTRRELSYSDELKALFLSLLFQTLKGADGVYEERSLGVSVLDPDSTLKKDNLFFRGHGDERWSLSSSLIRVLLSQIDGASTAISPDIFESGLNVIELQSIDVARRNGLVRNLGAFTLTAVLQHHESPTRLLDVSQDWRIALYFASTNEAHCDGRVFIFYTNTTLTKLPVDNDYLPWDQRSVDNPHWGKATFLVKTPAIDSRMSAQAGHFLCGSTDFYAKSYALGKSISETVGKCSVNVDFPVWHRPRTSLTTLQALVRELETHQNTNINGASIVFDKDLKPLILDILSKDTADPIHHDVIYPPVSDVKRLLHHIAMEHLPLSLRIFPRKAERS